MEHLDKLRSPADADPRPQWEQHENGGSLSTKATSAAVPGGPATAAAASARPCRPPETAAPCQSAKQVKRDARVPPQPAQRQSPARASVRDTQGTPTGKLHLMTTPPNVLRTCVFVSLIKTRNHLLFTIFPTRQETTRDWWQEKCPRGHWIPCYNYPAKRAVTSLETPVCARQLCA